MAKEKREKEKDVGYCIYEGVMDICPVWKERAWNQTEEWRGGLVRPPAVSPSQQQQWVQTTDDGQSTKGPEGRSTASEAVRQAPCQAETLSGRDLSQLEPSEQDGWLGQSESSFVWLKYAAKNTSILKQFVLHAGIFTDGYDRITLANKRGNKCECWIFIVKPLKSGLVCVPKSIQPTYVLYSKSESVFLVVERGPGASSRGNPADLVFWLDVGTPTLPVGEFYMPFRGTVMSGQGSSLVHCIKQERIFYSAP